MGRASLGRRCWVAFSFTFVYLYVFLFVDIPRLLMGRRKKVEGQVAVITGGAQGIGKEVARLLAVRDKAVCCIIDVNEIIDRLNLNEVASQEEKAGRQSEQEIREAGGEAHFYRADISNYQEMCQTAENIRVNHGSVDILVANAAILKFGEVTDLTFEDYKLNNDVNINGHIWTIKAFYSQMLAANSGHIISVGSICSHFGEYCGTAYCTAKFACRGFMEALQMELYEKGLERHIKLTNVFPYFVKTPFIQDLEEPYCTFFDVMEAEKCASEVVDSILLERFSHFIPGGIGFLCVQLKCLVTKGTLPLGRRAFAFRYRPRIAVIPEKIV